VVLTPATRQRLVFEFLPMVQDALASAVVYFIVRDVAKGLVVPLGWKQARDDVRRFAKPHELPSLDRWSVEFFLAR
jgi:hypothetical protein